MHPGKMVALRSNGTSHCLDVDFIQGQTTINCGMNQCSRDEYKSCPVDTFMLALRLLALNGIVA